MKPRLSVPTWAEPLRDAGIRAIGVLVLVAIAGFVMLGVAWHGAAGTIFVPLQMPWLVSGSLLGVAVIGMALGGWSIHLGRRQDATHRDAAETLVRDAIALCEAVRVRRGEDPDRH